MNLNSYIGLIARNFRTAIEPDGLRLEECEAVHAQLRIPNAKYIITVDADTLLVHNYALRLIHVMERDENRRVAIAQSPHRPIPDSPIVLERTAGAQTDIQRMLCQRSAHYGAAFWVGGSATMHRDALEDVCEQAVERRYQFRKYIRDRTLVEDTESSLSFLAKGWSIYNYLDPLTYSVTPGDFGALIVQRRRWSSGGLLNIPALGQYLRKADQRKNQIPEAILRFHYLASTTVNLGMLLLPLLAANGRHQIGWFLLSALAYYTLYARDLFLCGYSWINLPRVYALNLLLIPVSVSGVINLIRQWWTGRKPTFERTPKIRERTPIPPSYVTVAWLIPSATLMIAILEMISGGISIALLEVLNAVLLSIAFVQFIRAARELAGSERRLFLQGRKADVQAVSACSSRGGEPLIAGFATLSAISYAAARWTRDKPEIATNGGGRSRTLLKGECYDRRTTNSSVGRMAVLARLFHGNLICSSDL